MITYFSYVCFRCFVVQTPRLIMMYMKNSEPCLAKWIRFIIIIIFGYPVCQNQDVNWRILYWWWFVHFHLLLFMFVYHCGLLYLYIVTYHVVNFWWHCPYLEAMSSHLDLQIYPTKGPNWNSKFDTKCSI